MYFKIRKNYLTLHYLVKFCWKYIYDSINLLNIKPFLTYQLRFFCVHCSLKLNISLFLILLVSLKSNNPLNIFFLKLYIYLPDVLDPSCITNISKLLIPSISSLWLTLVTFRGFKNLNRSDQIRSDQIRSDQIRSDQIRSIVQWLPLVLTRVTYRFDALKDLSEETSKNENILSMGVVSINGSTFTRLIDRKKN